MQRLVLALSLLISGFAHADPGFLRLGFPEIPAAVQLAGESVFEVHVLDPRSRLTLNLEAFGQDYDRKIKGDHLLPRVESIVLAQLKACYVDKRKSCELFTNTVQASAFAIEDGRTLLTILETQGTPVIVFDRKGGIVYWGRATEDGSAATSDAKVRLHRLRLDSEIARPLPIATKAAPIGSTIFALGYPVATGPYAKRLRTPIYGLESRNPLPDSKGDGLFVSIGKVLALDGATAIVTDADTVFGSQGGPLINSEGEVVALVTGGGASGYNLNTPVAIRQTGYIVSPFTRD